MFRLSSKISIEKELGQKYDWDFVTDVEINSSWSNFTETAVLTFPKNVKFFGNDIAGNDKPLFNRGDKIYIQLGYDDQLRVEFSGYVTKIIPGVPVQIECENESYLLKRKVIDKLSFKSVSLGDLLSEILPDGIEFESPDAELGAFRVTNATALQVLDELKKTYGFPAFFRNGKLYVGHTYVEELREQHEIKFEREVVNSALEWQDKENTKIKVKAISMLPDNTKLSVEVGDVDGELRTLTYYNITSETELENRANEEIDRLRYDGYRGTFTMFGNAVVQHQHVVELFDAKFPERDGEYFVKSHRVIFGQSGFRREIELGIKSQ